MEHAACLLPARQLSDPRGGVQAGLGAALFFPSVPRVPAEVTTMTKRKRLPRQRGVTLMEMVVVVAIFSVIFIISYSLLEDTVKTSLFVEEHNDLPIYGQTAINSIQRELLQARVVFEGSAGTFGPASFSALTWPT